VKQPFSIKDTLHIEGPTTCMDMLLESMELDGRKISTAEVGTVIGIEVSNKTRPNDLVYKIAEED
jgi:hypothetical protein